MPISCYAPLSPVRAIVGQGGDLTNCRSLAKECPWAEHLTNSSKRGGGHSFECFRI